MKVLEVTLLALVTTSLAYWLPYVVAEQCFINTATNGGTDESDKGWKFLVQYNCRDGYFSPMATLFFNSEGTIIKSIVTGFTYHTTQLSLLSTSTIGVFGVFWMFFSILTYGSAVPTGSFLYAIVVGAAVGQIWENIRTDLMGVEANALTSLPLVIGAAAMIASTTRLSYSVVVLMLETSNAFNLAIPMIIAVFLSKMTGDFLTNSLYDREIREANIPVLVGTCPRQSKNKKAMEIMAKSPITVTTIAEMRQIQIALDSPHHAFPVLNTAGHLVGLVPKIILLKLTEQKCWYETERASMAVRERSREQKMQDVENAQTLLEKLKIINQETDKYDSNFDEQEGFPATRQDKLIHKQQFNSKIDGQDPDCERVLNDICDHYPDEMIDLRPYMWEYPYTVTVHDTVEKCLNIFLMNHLRHLCVVNPVDGACVGIITRKDLFAFVDI